MRSPPAPASWTAAGGGGTEKVSGRPAGAARSKRVCRCVEVGLAITDGTPGLGGTALRSSVHSTVSTAADHDGVDADRYQPCPTVYVRRAERRRVAGTSAARAGDSEACEASIGIGTAGPRRAKDGGQEGSRDGESERQRARVAQLSLSNPGPAPKIASTHSRYGVLYLGSFDPKAG